MDLKKYIKNVNDFPKEGIIFRDITPLMANNQTYKYANDLLSEFSRNLNATHIVGPEARGFVFGCPVAYNLNIGFVPVRKPGKLPRETIDISYDLEYGSNTLSIHKEDLNVGDRVVIIDDLLATGGTIDATIKLIEQSGAKVVGIGFLIELVDLKGRELLKDYEVLSLIKY